MPDGELISNVDYWDVMFDEDDAQYFNDWFTFIVHDDFYGPYLSNEQIIGKSTFVSNFELADNHIPLKSVGLFLQWSILRTLGTDLNSQIFEIIHPPNRPFTHRYVCLI